MKHRQTVFLLLAVLCAFVMLFVIISILTRPTSPDNGSVETPPIPTGTETTSPLYLTTMTHMEGNWDFVLESEEAFDRQVEKLEYGMDLADEYDATLTIESEAPFARANVKWNRNVMQEILDRGHGVGTHCDVGGRIEMTYDEYVAALTLRKTLVDALVGPEQNKGCSGAGGYNDWAQGMVEAGFEYAGGLVGFHMLAFPRSQRPDGWNDARIIETYYHTEIPLDLQERIHLFRLADTRDWDEDDTGIVVSAGGVGQLSYLAEGDREACVAGECALTQEDVDTAVQLVMEAYELHDPSRVAKITFYLPTSDFEEEHDDVLRSFFSEMQKLQEAGIIQWASQLDVYEAYIQGGDIE